MPLYQEVDSAGQETLGIQRLDHAVGNVHKLAEAAAYVMGFTGVQRIPTQMMMTAVIAQGALRTKLACLHCPSPACATGVFD